MSLVLLYILATLDGAFCGYRAAAGRTALIDKRGYYRRALLRGAAMVQGAVALAAVVLIGMIALSPAPGALISDLLQAAARMLQVYLPYAALGLAAFAVRLLPSVDFRSATSVFVFGPMTAVRPLVAAAGVLHGIIPAAERQTRLIGLTVLALMFAVQVLLDGIARHESELSLPGPSDPQH